MKIQIGICDKEVSMQTRLSEICTRILTKSEIKVYDNGRELLESAIKFDLILADISMPELDGLKTMEEYCKSPYYKNHRPAIIFISSHREFVFEALDLHIFHYLIKPLDEKKLEKILKSAVSERFRYKSETPLTFRTKSSCWHVCPSRIFYIESNLRKVIIHTDGETLELYAAMADLEKLLDDCFYRCHRGYLVNVEKIVGYDRHNIYLMDGSHILLAKTKYQEFAAVYQNYLAGSLQENTDAPTF